MGTAVRPPAPSFAAVVEWRASRIQDPVRRLRYLQRHQQTRRLPFEWRSWSGRRIALSAFLWLWIFIPSYTPSHGSGPSNAFPAPDAVAVEARYAVPQVWQVEKTAAFDLYSNGLRVENEFATAGKPRRTYPVYALKTSRSGRTGEEPTSWRSDPAGIVFHSTESHQAPFEASELRSLKRIGRNLLDYVRSQQSYHFVIDRFGRVFRVVAETDIAHHSGRSVWSDTKGVYVSLNASFLSIAFEAQTDVSLPMSPAQSHSAKVLTAMLRSRFAIPASNCVTHAQVSVNPSNWRIGYHTDWASGFAFAELGLPDNYARTLPAMLQFGFEYDDAFLAAAGRPWEGLGATDRLILNLARADGVSPAVYRERLQDRYRKISAQVRANEEIQDEK